MRSRASYVIGLSVGLMLCGIRHPGFSADSPSRRVIARKGPIELWLEVKTIDIRAGGRLRVKLGFRNMGRESIVVPDDLARDFTSLGDNYLLKSGVYVEVVDQQGRPQVGLPLPHGWGAEKCIKVYSSTGSIPSDMEKARPYVKLSPGESIVSPSWEFVPSCANSGRPSRDGYADLWQFVFERRGSYRVRAVYDQVPSQLAIKLTRRRVLPEEIRVETEWIELTAR